MRFALGIEYDGSGFLGWQTQPAGGTVQDALQSALSVIAAEPVTVTCAGRTDRGVHARGQVVHFDCRAERPLSAWVRGVNALLPDAIAVLWARPVAEGFHARYGALRRTYRYVLVNRAVRPAIASRYAGWCHAPLDIDRMREAAAALVGEHDFSAFRSAECQATTPVRRMLALDIEPQGERVDFLFCANAFLHHMVRNLVGSLIYVGRRKQPPGWIRELLASRDRARAAPTFAASGLYLERVDYATEWGIPCTVAGPVVLAEPA